MIVSRASHRLAWVVAILLPLPADAFTAKNGMDAHQVGPTEIVVDYHPRRDETDYWCAAGDFADRVFGVSGKTRLWRASEKPREAGRGIVFTLDPAKMVKGGGPSQFGTGPRDGSISVGMAIGNYCRQVWPYLW